jgi:hypothetical protein
MIPSWRKRKKLERQERQRSMDDYPKRKDGTRGSHRKALERKRRDHDFLDEIVEERAAKSPSFLRMVEDGDGEIVVSDDCPLSDDELRSMNRGGGRFRGGGEPPERS